MKPLGRRAQRTTTWKRRRPPSSNPLSTSSLFRPNHGAPAPGFRIRRYSVRGFLEKTKDPVSPDLTACRHLQSISAHPRRGSKPARRRRRRRRARQGDGAQHAWQPVPYAAGQAHGASTRPTLTSCARSSRTPRGGKLTRRCVLDQLRYAGVFEAEHPQSGYPFRMSLERFTTGTAACCCRAAAPALRPPRLRRWRASSFAVGRGRRPSAGGPDPRALRSRTRQRRSARAGAVPPRSGAIELLPPSPSPPSCRTCRRTSAATSRGVPPRAHVCRELRRVLETACSVSECDEAARQHGHTLGAHARLFAPAGRDAQTPAAASRVWRVGEPREELSLARGL